MIPNPHYHTSDSAVRKRYMAHVEAIRRKREQAKAEPEPEKISDGCIAVIRISDDGERTPFHSIYAASRGSHIHRDCIHRALKGEAKKGKAAGYRWEYDKNDAA